MQNAKKILPVRMQVEVVFRFVRDVIKMMKFCISVCEDTNRGRDLILQLFLSPYKNRNATLAPHHIFKFRSFPIFLSEIILGL